MSPSAVNCYVSPAVGNWGPHLVVVRSCNILKWELELKRWCPGLKILLYFGSQRELRAKRQVFCNSFSVVVSILHGETFNLHLSVCSLPPDGL